MGTRVPAFGAEAFVDASSIAAQGRQTFDLSAFGKVPTGCTVRVLGVAPGASLVALKINGASAYFNSAVIQAIDYAVTVDHVDVINESLGGYPLPDTGDDPVSLANAAAVAAGATISAGSGDAGAGNTVGSPASAALGSRGILAVGATEQLRILQQVPYFPGRHAWYSGNLANVLERDHPDRADAGSAGARR